MKTKSFLTMLCVGMAIATNACGGNVDQTNFKYKIDGKTNYIPDNQNIILAHGIYSGQKPLDKQIITTLKVQKGSFSFEGVARQPEACTLYLPAEGAFMPVILEKGTIQVVFDEDPIKTFVKGTPLNDSLHNLAKINIRCAELFEQQLKGVHNPPTTEEINKIERLQRQFQNEIGNIHYACALRNIQNELGFFLIVSSRKFFTLEQLANLLVKLPKQKHDHPIIRELDNLVIEKKKK